MHIHVFTDGSSRGNPGPGGWGVSILFSDKVKEMGGREEKTTNNRMELMAIREALRAIEKDKHEGDVALHTDSSYAMNGLIGWMYAWEKNNWKTKTGEDVSNQDLWKELLGIMFRLKHERTIDIKKVDGHAGVPLNERVDQIATGYADNERVLLFSGSLTNYKKLLGENILSLKPVPGSATTKKKSSSARAYSYVSLVDGKLHIDATWAECERRVKGKRGAKYKKAISKEDEEMIKKVFVTS